MTTCGRRDSTHIVDPFFRRAKPWSVCFRSRIASFLSFKPVVGISKALVNPFGFRRRGNARFIFILKITHTGADKRQRIRRCWVLLTADRWLYQWLFQWQVLNYSHQKSRTTNNSGISLWVRYCVILIVHPGDTVNSLCWSVYASSFNICFILWFSLHNLRQKSLNICVFIFYFIFFF